MIQITYNTICIIVLQNFHYGFVGFILRRPKLFQDQEIVQFLVPTRHRQQQICDSKWSRVVSDLDGYRMNGCLIRVFHYNDTSHLLENQHISLIQARWFLFRLEQWTFLMLCWN